MSESGRITAVIMGLTLAFIGILTLLGFIYFSFQPPPLNSFVVLFNNPPIANAYIYFVTPPQNYIDLPIAIGFLIGGLILFFQGVRR